jgi:DNA-binding NarL/FixJ family response regulator
MKNLTPADATILLLDSDPLMRAALRDALESAGYLVVDLLIMRPYINSMPGHMAADYLRTKRHGLTVLIIGGFMDDDRVRDQNAISMYHIFPKPFDRSELLVSVKEVLSTIRKS